MDRIGQNWTEFRQNWTELDRIRQNWTELDRIGQNWTEWDRIGQNWTKLDRIVPEVKKVQTENKATCLFTENIVKIYILCVSQCTTVYVFS